MASSVTRRAWMRTMTRCSRACLLGRVDEAVVAGMAGVPPRQGVEMLDGALGHELGLAADLDEAGRVVRVHDSRLTRGSAARSRPLRRCERRVDPGAGPVVVHPDEAGMRLAVRQQRREHAADGPLQQVAVRVRDGLVRRAAAPSSPALRPRWRPGRRRGSAGSGRGPAPPSPRSGPGCSRRSSGSGRPTYFEASASRCSRAPSSVICSTRAADLEVAQRLAGVVAEQRHSRVAAHVPLLAEAPHRVDAHERAVEVAPHDRRLR